MRFDNNFRTTVPTGKLIANYQTLALAVRDYNGDRIDSTILIEQVELVMKSLNDIIRHETPSHSGMTPTGYSIVMPKTSPGLYVKDDGKELTCAGGRPIGELFRCQCGDCPHAKQSGCQPEEHRILLSNGVRYDRTQESNLALRLMEE